MLDKAQGWGRLGSAADELEHRARALSDPGAYHGDIAARELHWFDGSEWITLGEDGEWRGIPGEGDIPGERGNLGASGESNESNESRENDKNDARRCLRTRRAP